MRRIRVLVPAVVAVTVGALLTFATPAAAAAAGTSYTWTGGGTDDAWTDSLNWAPVGVPGDGDSVLVEGPSDGICNVHVDSVPSGLTLAALTLDEHLFQDDPDSACLTSITGGSITVQQQLTFHAGTIDTPITVAVGATASVTPGSAHDTTAFSAAVTVQGTMTLSGNTGAESLSLTDSPGITVAPGGTLTSQGDNDVSADCCNSPAHIVNHGTIAVGVGTLDTYGVELDQDATLTAPAGAQLITAFAPQTAASGATWKGAGSWNMHLGTITATGTQTLSGGFRWILGGHGSTSEEYLGGKFSLAGTGTFEWAGGQIQAALTLGHGITAVAGGVDGPDVRSLYGLDDSTSPPTPLSVTVHGTLGFTGGAGYHGTAAGRLVVASDGRLTMDPGTAVGADCCTTPSTIVNSGGAFVVPSAASGALPVTLANVGYRATGGTTTVGTNAVLALTGGGAGLLSGTTVTGGGTVAVTSAVSLTGTDTVGPATTIALQDTGTLAGTGTATATLSGSGAFTWTGGGVTGKLVVATSGGQTLSGTATPKRVQLAAGASTASLTLAGPTTIAAGTVKAPDRISSDPGATVTFTGTTAIAANVTFGGGAFVTTGTTTVRAGSGSVYATSNATFTNRGTLTVSTGTLRADNDLVQTAGSTTVAAGAAVQIVGSSAVLRLSAGTLTGAGTVDGPVVVTAATVAPGNKGVGTLTVTGDYTTSAKSTLSVDVGSAGSDLLTVGGVAALGGTLVVNDVAGYTPVTGATATVLTGATVTRTFTCTTSTGAGAANQHWTVRKAAGAVVLTSAVGAPTSC